MGTITICFILGCIIGLGILIVTSILHRDCVDYKYGSLIDMDHFNLVVHILPQTIRINNIDSTTSDKIEAIEKQISTLIDQLKSYERYNSKL